MPMSDETRHRLEAIALHHGDRTAAILAARAEGASLREIADAVGLTHPAIKHILDNATKEAS